MLPIRWDPFKDLGVLHREIDDLFRRTFGVERETEMETGAMRAPLVNTFVKENVYHIQAELPGIDKKDLDVSIDGNVLTLRGERKMSKEAKEEDYHLREFRFGSFVRRLTLPEGVNTEKVHASYEDGILKITMPMSKKMIGGRKILIEGAEEGKRKGEVH
jgi:HSP20 family protein